MYRVLPRSFVITALVVLGAALLALVMGLWEWASGEPVGWWQMPRAVSMVAGLITFLLAVVLQVVWRPLWRWIPALNRLVFPDLNGPWRGELDSNWVDPETSERLAPKPVTVIIKQGWFDVSVRMRTEEVQSYSNRVFLEREKGTHVFHIWYGYGHRPRPEHRPGNPPHEGMAYLEYDADQPDERVYGQYYTDRQTTGEFTLTRD